MAPVKQKKGEGKAKPKNNIVKSNSSYVSRVIPHEALQKRLSERSQDGLMAFANVNRAFMWLGLVIGHQDGEHDKSTIHEGARALPRHQSAYEVE